MTNSPSSNEEEVRGVPRTAVTQPRSKSIQTFWSNLTWLSLDKIGKLLITASVGVILARSLGASAFGTLNFALAIFSLLFAFAGLGLEAVLLRSLILFPINTNRLLGTACLLRIFASFMILILFVISTQLIGLPRFEIRILTTILLIGSLFQSFEVIDLYFQSRNQFKYVATAKTITLVITSVLKGLVAYYTRNLYLVTALFALDNVLNAALLIKFFSLHSRDIGRWMASKRLGSRLLTQSWPLMVSNLSILIYMRIDQIMLGSMIGSVAVGQYSAAIRISEIFYYIPVVFTTAFTPIITRLRQSDPSRYLFQFHRLFFVLTLGSYVCSILMHFGSIPIIRIIFGAQYAQAAPILAIHIWTCVFVFLGVAQGPWYVNEGMTQRAMARSLVGAASNILLNLFLIPRYGPLGAAYATLFSQALSSFLFNASHRKTRPIFMIQLKALLLIPPRNPKITSPPLVQI